MDDFNKEQEGRKRKLWGNSQSPRHEGTKFKTARKFRDSWNSPLRKK
jgi:hypothetical protein